MDIDCGCLRRLDAKTQFDVGENQANAWQPALFF